MPKTITKQKEVLVNFILDKSGSMESTRNSTISGFNEYIQTLKKDGVKYSFSLVLFDNNVTKMYINEPLEDVKELDVETYRPDGGTALYDSVCSTIAAIKEKKGQKVITIIMTDGQENASKEYTEVQMKAMIQEREKKGTWTFVYMGANQDSYAVAQKYGIQHGNSINYMASDLGTRSAMKTMATNTSNLSASSVSNTANFFAATDQETLINADIKVQAHFSALGKKSWDKRKNNLIK